jgi:hypothetical protein
VSRCTQLQPSKLPAQLFLPDCLQLVEIMPCLDKLPELLGRPYSFEDGEEQQQAAAGQGPDDMDTDGPGPVAAAGPGSTALQRQQQGPLTLEQLLQRVQVRE